MPFKINLCIMLCVEGLKWRKLTSPSKDSNDLKINLCITAASAHYLLLSQKKGLFIRGHKRNLQHFKTCGWCFSIWDCSCCQPELPSFFLIFGPTSKETRQCLYVPFESSSVTDSRLKDPSRLPSLTWKPTRASLSLKAFILWVYRHVKLRFSSDARPPTGLDHSRTQQRHIFIWLDTKAVVQKVLKQPACEVASRYPLISAR